MQLKKNTKNTTISLQNVSIKHDSVGGHIHMLTVSTSPKFTVRSTLVPGTDYSFRMVSWHFKAEVDKVRVARQI